MPKNYAAIAWHQPTSCGKTPRRMVGYLMAFLGLSMFPTASYIPSLPTISQHLHMNEVMAQATITIFLAAMGIGSLLFGPIAHHIGRRYALTVACLSFIAGASLCLWGEHSYAFLLGRLLQGLGSSGLITVGRTVMRDLFSGQEMATISRYTIPTGPLAVATGPVLGGYLQVNGGWQSIFYFSIAVYIGILIAVLIDFPETKPTLQTERPGFIQAYLSISQSTTFAYLTTCAGLGMGLIATFQAISPLLLLNQLHLSATSFTMVGLTACPAILLGSYLSHRFKSYNNDAPPLYLAALLFTIAGLGTWITGLMGYLNLTSILIAYALGMIGATLTFIHGFAAAINPWPHLASFAAALYNAWQCSIAGLTSLVVAFVPDTNQVPMGIIWCAIGVLQSILVYLAFRHHSTP